MRLHTPVHAPPQCVEEEDGHGPKDAREGHVQHGDDEAEALDGFELRRGQRRKNGPQIAALAGGSAM